MHFCLLRFIVLRVTDEGNQITIDVKPLQAGCGHTKGIFISCPILRAIIPVKGDL